MSAFFLFSGREAGRVLTAVRFASHHAFRSHKVEFHASWTDKVLSVTVLAEGVLAAVVWVGHVGNLTDAARLSVIDARIDCASRSAGLAFAKLIRSAVRVCVVEDSVAFLERGLGDGLGVLDSGFAESYACR